MGAVAQLSAAATRMLEATEAVVQVQKPVAEAKVSDPLANTAYEVTEAVMARWEAGELDIEVVKEIADDLKAEGGAIGKRVAEKLLGYIQTEVRNQGLCPECYAELEEGGFVKELMGECWGSPAYQEVATKMECPKCGYEEEL